ncbi:uncharacterized protein LOC111706736 [Eurytemora carolleeae]|uniref:uncharacterized protein LOC111706736 n=1 Tax=Eurytemora carolleeae TaxID=1294199 RepID=UPI000C783A1C|nr:uncharacterized protein LOC111706736 [Eurytemora carolleeae]|eukprot:XP_023335429.1 uncharacterized protein LOC111706736 [Eurytemora affinis]
MVLVLLILSVVGVSISECAIYRPTGDSVMRLSQAGGQLLLEEGHLSQNFYRNKRIAKNSEFRAMEKSNRFSQDDSNSVISEYPEQDISAYQRGSISPVNIEALETRAQDLAMSQIYELDSSHCFEK